MTEAVPAHPWVIERGRSDVVPTVLGCSVLLLAAWPVDAGRVPGAEGAVFRVLNGTTVLPFGSSGR